MGKKLVGAGRLKLRPLCVYGTEDVPQGAVPSYTIDRCIAKAVYTAALFEKTPQMYIEAGHEQCCPGGIVWMGFSEPHPRLKYFVRGHARLSWWSSRAFEGNAGTVR